MIKDDLYLLTLDPGQDDLLGDAGVVGLGQLQDHRSVHGVHRRGHHAHVLG